jgi:hypothetical protein
MTSLILQYCPCPPVVGSDKRAPADDDYAHPCSSPAPRCSGRPVWRAARCRTVGVAARDDAERRPGRALHRPGAAGAHRLNLMSTGLWGMGFGFVQARQKEADIAKLISAPQQPILSAAAARK